MTTHDTSRTDNDYVRDKSLGELFASLSEDVSTLMRQEVALAKAEVRQSAKQAGTGAAMLAGAGVAALFMLGFLSNTLWEALSGPLGRTVAALIVAAVWAVIAVILGLVGKSKLKKVEGVPQTTETVKQIPNALKGHEEQNV